MIFDGVIQTNFTKGHDFFIVQQFLEEQQMFCVQVAGEMRMNSKGEPDVGICYKLGSELEKK